MNKFMTHAPCPKCGSADNVAVYQDGYERCYTPGCTYEKHSKGGYVSHKEDDHPSSYFPLLEGSSPTFLTEQRGITREALQDYGVKRVQIDKAIVVQFPYYLNGVPVAAKYRGCTDFHGKVVWQDKNYWSKGDIHKCRLFGMQVASDRKKSVIITEGELDALAAYGMYGLAYNVVSVSNGGQSAAKAIEEHIDWLMQWDTIYINFDMDEVGQTAASQCMSLFPPGKAKNIILPDGYKDACDMAKADKGQEYRDAVKKAQGVVPQGVLSTEDVINSTLDYILDIDQRKGVSTGYAQLDGVMGGFRPGEVVTLVAGTGVGKTTMTLNLTYNAALLSKLNTLFIPLEMSYKQVLVRLMEIHTKQPLMTTTGQPNPICEDKQKLTRILHEVTNNISIYNHVGSMDMKKLIGVLEYYAIAHKTKLIVLDHKDAAVNCLTDEGGSVKIIDNLMAELKRISIQYNLTVLVVSHLSRSKDDKEDSKASLNRVRGSAGVAQNSDIVLGLERDRDKNTLTVTTLKAHRIFGIYDQFNLYYNRDTLRIEEALITDLNEIREDEKRIREEDKSAQPTPVIRTQEVHVHEEVHTRLPVSNENRETNIHRSEGIPANTRPNKVSSGQAGQPRLRLADLISKRLEPNQSKVETFFYIRGLGNTS